MTSCSETRYFDPDTQTFIVADFGYSCNQPSEWCPFAVWVGGTITCCSNANESVCPDGSCVSDLDSCSPAPPPDPDPSEPPPPISQPSPTGLEVVCSNGIVCGNGYVCSIDDSPSCCPSEGQNYCPDAITCFDASANEVCCGNTICSAGFSCASAGDSCINDSPTSILPSSLPSSFPTSTSIQPSPSNPSFPSTLAIAIVPTQSASNSADNSALDILQTAVPDSVKSNPQGACFLKTEYTSYTTPPWFTAMPTPAQSYFASVNAQNTDACVVNQDTGDSGLSPGAKAGISVGAAAGAAVIAAIVYILIKAGVIGGGAAAAGGSAAAGPSGWSGVTGGNGGGWSGVTGSGAPAAAPPAASEIPPILVAGAMGRRRSDERDYSGGAFVPTPPPFNHGMVSRPNPQQSLSFSGYNHSRHPGQARSVSPPDPFMTRQEMLGSISPTSTEMSMSEGSPRRRTELPPNMRVPHLEIYSNERFEAPVRD